jgi:YesN/AraC family two-component response regulator
MDEVMKTHIAKLQTLKLLLVEDEIDLLEIITDTLKKLNVEFYTAHNGQEALEILEKSPDIDVVITDINMPILNGIELIVAMNEKAYNIPVVVMSAHTETEYIEQAQSLGVDNYLLKPFDFIKFIELMHNMDLSHVNR